MISLVSKYKTYLFLIVLVCLFSFIVGCNHITISSPYRTIDENAELEESYILIVTFAEVNDDHLSKAKFKDYLSDILDSMEKHDGLHGYSVRKQLFGNKSWTYSIWKQEKFIKYFKYSKYHKPAMLDSSDILKNAKFAKIEILSNELPYSWKKALSILESGNEINYRTE